MCLKQAQEECLSLRFGEFKPKLIEALIANMAPIRDEAKRLLEDEKYKQKYLLNQQIIDFEFIPEEIHNNIIKKYIE